MESFWGRLQPGVEGTWSAGVESRAGGIRAAAGGAGGEGAAQAALVGARQSRVLRVGRVRWGKERERKGV